MTFWRAFVDAARDAGVGALACVIIAAFLFACACLAFAGHYLAAAVVAGGVVFGTLAAMARNTQRRVAWDEHAWRAFSEREDP